MTAMQYLTWENFRATVFVHEQKRVHLISKKPNIEMFGDGENNRIGIWLEASSNIDLPLEWNALDCIQTCILAHKGKHLVEISTSVTLLHRQFYHFAIAVAERMIVEGKSPIDAIDLELRCFTDLLGEKPVLGIERQIGLIGELIFLERLLEKEGLDAVDAWLGPTKEPHDFRVDDREFEVKTTISTKRVHTIHGLEQLVPSESCSLHLVSVMLGPPAASVGFSLADKVATLESLLGSSEPHKRLFRTRLDESGYRAEDSSQYNRRFTSRRPMGVVQVDSQFPVISRPILEQTLGKIAFRVEGLQYEVNVDGLEIEDGNALFEKLVFGK